MFVSSAIRTSFRLSIPSYLFYESHYIIFVFQAQAVGFPSKRILYIFNRDGDGIRDYNPVVGFDKRYLIAVFEAQFFAYPYRQGYLSL
jgi:hypothetical protein